MHNSEDTLKLCVIAGHNLVEIEKAILIPCYYSIRGKMATLGSLGSYNNCTYLCESAPTDLL